MTGPFDDLPRAVLTKALEIAVSGIADTTNTGSFGYEIGIILRDAAEKFEQGYATFPLRDSNGNVVGRATLTTGD